MTFMLKLDIRVTIKVPVSVIVLAIYLLA